MEKLNLALEELQTVNSTLASFKKEVTACTEVLTNGLKDEAFESSDESVRLKLKKNKLELEEFKQDVTAMTKKVDRIMVLTAQSIKEAQK